MNFSSNIICDQVRTFILVQWATDLTQSATYFKGPWAWPVWGVPTLTSWAPVQITGTQNQRKRKLSFFTTAVPLLNCLSLPFCMVFTRVAVYRDPVKFEYDSSGVLCMWLGWSMGVRGGGLEGYVFCCDNLRYGFPFFSFFFFLFFLLNPVCLDLLSL